MTTVAARLSAVRERMVAVGADPATVRVVAVTKGFGADAVAAAAAAGLADVGENYAQELVGKAAAVPDLLPPGSPPPRWHFLGAVQRNKIPVLAPLVSCWQGLSRAAEGEAIARRRPGAEVLVEVELTGAPGRHGCALGEAPGLVAELQAMELDVRGLMVVAPRDRLGARHAFRSIRSLADELGLPERSMGMSDDFEDAVAEGSTMVRLGRALFGDRR